MSNAQDTLQAYDHDHSYLSIQLVTDPVIAGRVTLASSNHTVATKLH